MKIDFWYNHSRRDVASLDILFYPESATYRGNLYGHDGRIIGDYATQNSLELEQAFPRLVNFGR